MKKLLVGAALFSLLTGIPTLAMARDQQPRATIDGQYCYEGWTGDSFYSAHILLTNRPLAHKRLIDEASANYSVKHGTKVIDINISLPTPRSQWFVSYTSHDYLVRYRATAFKCLTHIFPDALKDYPLRKTRVKEFKSASGLF